MNMELSTKLYMQVQYTTDAMNTENNLFYVAINTKEISSWNRIFVFKQRSRKCNRFIPISAQIAHKHPKKYHLLSLNIILLMQDNIDKTSYL